jgi:selenophosphate synthetase-related protein
MLEAGPGLGCALRVADVPRPPGMALERWLCTFPSYAFLAVGDPAALTARFGGAGLAVAEIGTLDDTAAVRLRDGGREELVWDLAAEPLTGMGRA